MLYPTISNYINEKNASRVIEDYKSHISKMTEEKYKEYYAMYEEYNRMLKEMPEVYYINGAADGEEYIELMNKTENGVMGYLEIEKINVALPIYFGTSEEVLQKSVGHLEGSTLPIGGIGNHSVIAGHSGIANAEIFTDLDQMELGDTFSITCAGKDLTYVVDDISVVLPEEIESLQMVEGEDYVSLITCTPYAVNTHRLIVRGKRLQ